MGDSKFRLHSTPTRGRRQSFEKLYLESYSRVYGFVRLRMGNDPAVEDVVSETYLKAARAFDRFDPSRASFSTWVISMASNAIVDHWRRERPHVGFELVPESVFAEPDATSAVDDRELVGQLLSLLSPEEVDLVLMKYRDGMRNVEIAEALDMNPSTVSTKLYKAMHKMRDAAGA